jgi:hypothetical protein
MTSKNTTQATELSDQALLDVVGGHGGEHGHGGDDSDGHSGSHHFSGGDHDHHDHHEGIRDGIEHIREGVGDIIEGSLEIALNGAKAVHDTAVAVGVGVLNKLHHHHGKDC